MDPAALHHVLTNGALMHGAIDVNKPESPPPDDPLPKLAKFPLTALTGWKTPGEISPNEVRR
jgi:phosphoglycerate dehydrogenase-like enzyme